MSSRTEKSLINVKIIFIIYFLNIILQFFSRTIFLQFLTIEYLGINGLFSNILSMLNLTELGVGTAMSYALYKPCAEGDIKLIKQIMFLYKRIYIIIGVIILFLGLLITPLLPIFINNIPTNIGNIYLYYILYVINIAVSYFFTYKRSLIICNQNQYISTVTTFAKNIGTILFQLIVLWWTKNYCLYLIVQIIFTVLENISISVIANRQYPYLKDKSEMPPSEEINKIKKNILAMSLHKIGGVVVNGTDNLIITKYVSLTATGLYSNYAIVISAITSLVSQMFYSITASVGNLIVEKDEAETYDVFKRIFFINFLIYLFFGVGLIVVFNDLISFWVGKKYVLSLSIVICIIMSFVTNGMRRTVLIFKDASGLFWNDRYKPLAEAICNLLFSIPLTVRLGISGTFMGTILTNVFLSGAVESYVLYKYGFKKNVKEYIFLEIRYYTIFVIGLICSLLISNFININSILNIVCKGVVVILILGFEVLVFFGKSDEFQYFFAMVKNVLRNKLITNMRK